MSVTLQLSRNKKVGDIQSEFNQAYPFLKIEMYKPSGRGQFEGGRIKLGNATILGNAEILEEGELVVFDAMTVGQFEKAFLEKFGVLAQISRKSGPIWLETTMTDRWTLKQQNEHGRELSEPVSRPLPDDQSNAGQ